MKKILLVLLLIVASGFADETRIQYDEYGDKITVRASGNGKGFLNLEIKPEYKSSPVILDKITVAGITIGEKLNTNDKTIIPLDRVGYYLKALPSDKTMPYTMIEISIVPSTGIVASIMLMHKDDITIEKCSDSKNYFLQNAFEKYGGEFKNEPRIGHSYFYERNGEIKTVEHQSSKGSIIMSNGNTIEYSCFSTGKSVLPIARFLNKQLYDKKSEETVANHVLNKKQAIDNLLQ